MSAFAYLNKDKHFQEVRKKAVSSTKCRNKHKEIMIARWANPEYRKSQKEKRLKKKAEKMYDPLNMPVPKPKFGSTEHREQSSQNQKIRVQDLTYIKKISEGVLRKYNDKEWAEQQRQRARDLTQTPEWQKKNSDGQKKSQKTKEHCKRMVQIKNEKLKTDKTFKEQIGEKQRKRNLKMWQDPEYVKRFKESRTGQKRNEIQRSRMQEAQIGGYWIGNVRYGNAPIYCELWKDVNPRVHAFQNHKCFLCGVPENGRSHAGHHVFYVKEACCWHSDNGIYYTNLNARNRQENDYCIGENPNYFVILCKTCHGKTNGGFKNRKKYADLFKQMIDDNYGGKSYFTKEEYASISGSSQTDHQSGD
jgi:hypothetical protein